MHNMSAALVMASVSVAFSISLEPQDACVEKETQILSLQDPAGRKHEAICECEQMGVGGDMIYFNIAKTRWANVLRCRRQRDRR